jgi:hypothetical protein
MSTNIVTRNVMHALVALTVLLGAMVPVTVGPAGTASVQVAEASPIPVLGLGGGQVAAISGDTPRYAITIDSIYGGPQSAPPLYYTNNVSVSGSVSANNFPGSLSQYQVQVDWGDGSVYNTSTADLALSASGKDFTGTWSSSPGHAYTQSGNYTITARLYHAAPPGNDGAADSFTQIGAVMVIPSAIVGTVFDDLNGNSALDSGETGIGGVSLVLSGVADVVTTTLEDGFFHFDNLAAGSYVVTEIDPPGYWSTTPNQVEVSVSATGEVYTVSYGDTNNVIDGTVYDDANGNGARDQGELGLSGVTVTLGGLTTDVTDTDQSGRYSFRFSSSGNYTISASTPPGYYATTPDNVTLSAIVGNAYQSDFGKTPLNTCSLTLSPKSANNQLPETASETLAAALTDQHGAGISGQIISLYTTFGSLSSNNVTTDAGGSASFAISSAIPGTSTIVATLGSLTDNATANWISAGDPTAYIEGTVYDDANGDGAWDQGELGLRGVLVAINGSTSNITDQDGHYSLRLNSSDNYTVSASTPAGYYSTTPNSVTISVTVGSAYQADFGQAPMVLDLSPKVSNNQLPGITSETLIAMVTDQHGAGISGQTVNLTTSFGSLSSSNVTTGEGGSATVTLVSQIPGTSIVVATLGPLSDNATANWLADSSGGTGGVPSPAPAPLPPPTTTPASDPAADQSSTVLTFTVDFLGRITKGTISSDGRLLESLDAPSPDGSHMLSFAQDTKAVDGQGKIVTLVQIREAGQVPRLPDNSVLVGEAYEFTPSGATFDGQVRITLGYDPQALPQLTSSIWIGSYQTPSGWGMLVSEQNRVAGVGQLTAAVPHFSIFAVLAGTTPGVLRSANLQTPTDTIPASFRSTNLQISPVRRAMWRFFPVIELKGCEVTVSADAVNEGGQSGTYGVELTIDGKKIGQTDLTLDPLEAQSVTFGINGIAFGQHTIEVGGISGLFVTSFSINWWLPVALVLVLGAIGWLISRWMRAKLQHAGDEQMPDTSSVIQPRN